MGNSNNKDNINNNFNEEKKIDDPKYKLLYF